MADEFDAPAPPGSGGDRFTFGDHLGRLLLITSHVLEKEITTSAGTTDAIRADIVVLDGPGAPLEFPDSLLFGRVLRGQLSKNVGTGRKNLGRAAKGEKVPGKTQAWIVTDPTDADKAIARAFLLTSVAAPF